MRRNFEFITQLGLQLGVTDKPKADANERAAAADAVPVRSSNPSSAGGDAGGEEIARFILEMFPRGGGTPEG